MPEDFSNLEATQKKYEERRSQKIDEAAEALRTAPTEAALAADKQKRAETVHTLIKLNVPAPEIVKRLNKIITPGGVVEFDSVPQLVDVLKNFSNLPHPDIQKLANYVNERANIINQLRFSDGRLVPAGIGIRFVELNDGAISLEYHVLPAFPSGITQGEQETIRSRLKLRLKELGLEDGPQPFSA